MVAAVDGGKGNDVVGWGNGDSGGVDDDSGNDGWESIKIKKDKKINFKKNNF